MYFSVNAANMVRQNRHKKCSMSRPAACSAEVTACPTPMVNLKLKAKKNQEDYLATIRALPDTGASVDYIEESFAKKHNLVIQSDTSNMIELISVEEKVMKVIRTTKVKIMANGGKWVTTVALVYPRLSHQMLLSWITQKKLQILHPDWPFCIITTANTATVSEFNTTPKHFRPKETSPDPQKPAWPKPEWPKELPELCLEFSDVLVEELTEAQNKQCPPIDVELQKGAKPFFVRKPRKTPLHWGEKVKKEVKKLLKAGVIKRIPANESAQWISPAGFVAKNEKEEKLRLVCDLRQLNKACKPDSSVFSTPNEVMQSLSSASQYFVNADLLTGYHQIALSDKSHNLFCFALEDGLYRCTCAPMG